MSCAQVWGSQWGPSTPFHQTLLPLGALLDVAPPGTQAPLFQLGMCCSELFPFSNKEMHQ